MLEKLQRFGGAMMTPVMLMPFAGIVLGLSSVFMNQDIMGSLAAEGSLWYIFWSMMYDGGYAIFNQLPLLFVISLPIGLAKKASGRAAMESFVIYIIFNYFVQSLLSNFGATLFNVDFSAEVGGTSGLTLIAGIKTLDMSVIGAIMVAAISIWIHNKWYEKRLSGALSSFQGSALVVIIGFVLMLPLAVAICFVWPMVQRAILELQTFLTQSGNLGVFLFTFLERVTIPTGLHHFLWTPIDLGPAVVPDGNWPHWMANISQFASSTAPLKELFPTGGFSLYGNIGVFGMPAVALAMYFNALPENRKKVAGMLISVTIPAVLCGITEPIEFTFLFISPILFVVSSLLAALMSTVLYMFGVVGYFGEGLISYLTCNWIPMFQNHSYEVIIHIVIGLIFSVIYFLVFYWAIKKFNIMTPGRQKEENLLNGDETERDNKTNSSNDVFREEAKGFLAALGGKENIVDVTNCITRLRLTVKDETIVADDEEFKKYNARGVVRKGKAIQVIIGMDVEIVRNEFDKLL